MIGRTAVAKHMGQAVALDLENLGAGLLAQAAAHTSGEINTYLHFTLPPLQPQKRREIVKIVQQKR